MLIARAEVEGLSPVDVRLEGGTIAAIARDLSRRAGEEVLDAAGGALLPGLHDHHIHLLASAAAARSVRCGPPEVRDVTSLGLALRRAPDFAGWSRGIGYHESVGGVLDRTALDALVPDRPARLQHRSGALWIVNSAGAERLGLDRAPTPPGVERDARGRATGRLYRMDRWLRDRLEAPGVPSLAALGQRLAGLGVTGLTDATAHNGPDELALLAAARASHELPQRLVVMGGAALDASASPHLEVGPRKLVLDEEALPPFDSLRALVEEAHTSGRAVAFHCVTRAELVVALEALAAAGARAGDRIEHAAVAPPDAVARLAGLGVSVVTQPHFVRERGDRYLEEVALGDRPWLYRAAGLIAAGVPLGGGTDAPFGDLDPWRAMEAAVERRTESGRAIGDSERLGPERALALFTTAPGAPGGTPRRVVVGAEADLCLLDRPWHVARSALSQACIVATWIGGRLVWHAR